MDCVLLPIITNADDTSLQTTVKRETMCEPMARYKYVKGNFFRILRSYKFERELKLYTMVYRLLSTNRLLTHLRQIEMHTLLTVFTANNIMAYLQTTKNISTLLTNKVNNRRDLYHLLTFHNLLGSEDNFPSGC